jgi:predicted MPP superfamily phosphohydrolase
MKKNETPTGKLIFRIIIGIFISSIIIVGFSTKTTVGPQEPYVAQDENGPTGFKGVKGLYTPYYDSGSMNITYKDDEFEFSLIHITDTQYSSIDGEWSNLTSWIASIQSSYNVKMVVHTGDIVDAWNNATQWENSNASMYVLASAGIPYTWCLGNHDNNGSNTAQTLVGNYTSFSASTFWSEDWWLSNFGDSSTAVHFSVNGHKFIIVNVEYHANNTVLSWMKNIIEANTDTNIIVATHSYLNSTGGYGWLNSTWEDNFKALLDNYSNVIITLSGHDISGTAYNKDANGRQEIFFNRQEKDARCARIITFNLKQKDVVVKTYLTYSSEWLEDVNNSFSFNFKLI